MITRDRNSNTGFDFDVNIEVNDYDEDIKKKEELIKEAEEMMASENVSLNAVSNLRKKWKRIHYWESAFEDQLADKFEDILDSFYGKQKEYQKQAKEAKEELIKEAKELSESKNLNKANETMKELMAKWKNSGSCGKEMDDALWEEFNAARQTFFDKRHAYWTDMQNRFETAKKTKEELIVKASEYAQMEDVAKANNLLRDVMEQWKAAGSAGRDAEDELWDKFNAIRQQFFTRRDEFFKEVHKQQDEKYESKKELIEKASEIADLKEYTKQHTEEMKNLNAKWKEIGFCGKERDDAVWEEFRSHMDRYFNGLSQFNEERHEQWKMRMQDAKARKQDLLANQKRQLKRMEDGLVRLLSEREIKEEEERIEDKKKFIAELENQIADIEKQLND